MVSPETESTVQPGQPSIKEAAPYAEIVADPASLLPDLKAIPQAKATLVGGTIARLDRVRDQVTVQVFGGGRMNALFDPRTRVFLGGKEATLADLKVGERVYLETMLDDGTVFARTIRLKATPAVGESQGIVLKYRTDRGELTLRDAIAPSPVHVRINSSTKFMQGDRAVAASVLTAGSLVSVTFNSEGKSRDIARQVSILALPGTRYTFAGQVVHIDLRTGLLVLNSSIDRKTYEIYLDPSVAPDDNLHPGSKVTVVTNFEGSRYVARSLTIDSEEK
jgi:hypothetical protein